MHRGWDMVVFFGTKGKGCYDKIAIVYVGSNLTNDFL